MEKNTMFSRFTPWKAVTSILVVITGLSACDQTALKSALVESPPVSPVSLPNLNPSNSSKKKPQAEMILVAVDNTLSTTTSQIPRVTVENFTPLIKLVEQNGGEIRVVIICNNSDKRLYNFYMSEPLTENQPPTPLPKAGEINPLLLPKLQKQNQQEIVAYQQQQETLNKSKAARQQEAQQKSQEFITKLTEVLKTPANCHATDIIGMVKRGDLFLNETGNWQQPPRKTALLITDGLETVKKHPEKIEFSSRPQILLVSSGGQAGILQQLLGSSKPYESIEGAIRFIVGQQP
jgi:hypothetical protein